MRKVLSLLVVMMAGMVCVSAQTQKARPRFTEEKGATLRMEKAGTEAEAFSPGTSFSYAADEFKPGVVRVGPRTIYLKEGLRTDEVIRVLGKPASISERTENDIVITTYEFQRGEGYILIAEFVSGALVRSRTEMREPRTVQADR